MPCPTLAPIADTECEDLEQALAVNELGPFRLTKALFGRSPPPAATTAALVITTGLFSTGDRLWICDCPLMSSMGSPEATAAAINQAKAEGGHVIAIGTMVVRALESAGAANGRMRAFSGVASGRIGREACLRVVNAILTGVHQPGESHFKAFKTASSPRVSIPMTSQPRCACWRPCRTGSKPRRTQGKHNAGERGHE
jgi:NAD(P)-dependent dehydrogenase (short-subunit alcohol dehydrogenase family)